MSESTFKPGDKVMFISPNGEGDTKAVRGEEYTVEAADYRMVHTICGISCFPERFKLITPATSVVDPLDFTNLELRTVQSLILQSTALDLDISCKRESLNAAVAAKEEFTRLLGEYGVSVLVGKEGAAPVTQDSEPSDHVFVGLTVAELKLTDFQFMREGMELKFVGTQEQLDDELVEGMPGDIFTIVETDDWDSSVLLKNNNSGDIHWVYPSCDDNLEDVFKFV